MITKTSTIQAYKIREPLLVAHDGPSAAGANENQPISDISLWLSEREHLTPAGILERYYNDVYKLLLAKLVEFDRTVAVGEADAAKLRALVAELIRVKSLLEIKS